MLSEFLHIVWIYAGFLAALWWVLLRFMQFFQQDEYDAKRFLPWWIRTRSVEVPVTVSALIFGAATFAFSLSTAWLINWIAPLFLAAAGWSHSLKPAKKKLVLTSRVRRILWVTVFLELAGLIALPYIGASLSQNTSHVWHYFGAALLIQLTPLMMVLANIILHPIESAIQQHYLNEARTILHQVNPTIIGITGSYGKTSMKHLLAQILQSHEPTLATPGSVNTLMGITRMIREQLKPDHRFFAVEMGAYGIGSIQKLCRLTPPNAALVTVVGVAHYERFQSLETVTAAKSELPQSVGKDGIVVLNGDCPHCRSMKEKTNARVFFYGEHKDEYPLDCWLKHVELNEHGTRMEMELNGKAFTLQLPLFGRYQAHNAAGAFLLGVKLGVPPVSAIAALQQMQPVAHRLVVTKDAAGIITIDDAYNSNPDGFLSALEVLKELPGLRRILVTPGMVELGERTAVEHDKVAESAAKVCDWIIIVAGSRIPEFKVSLIKYGLSPKNIIERNTLDDAREWLKYHLVDGDIVLFENDLPDLYESPAAF